MKESTLFTPGVIQSTLRIGGILPIQYVQIVKDATVQHFYLHLYMVMHVHVFAVNHPAV